MTHRKGQLFVAFFIYVLTMTVLLTGVYRFLENWHMSTFNFFIAGALVILVAMGWGYILTTFIFAPSKQMEKTLTTLTDEIIHELNIPLSTIEANSMMLRKSLKDKKSLKRLQRIDEASVRLKRLYDELVYAISKEIQPIEKERFDVQSVVENRVSVFEEYGRNSFILELHYFEIEADKIGFEQMLDNILSNAMKYSAKNTLIKISLNQGRLCVEDEGIGMNEIELLRVHERYFQSNDTNEGSGIGLTLVKQYCEDEDIDIQIQSTKNKGTKICVTLD